MGRGRGRGRVGKWKGTWKKTKEEKGLGEGGREMGEGKRNRMGRGRGKSRVGKGKGYITAAVNSKKCELLLKNTELDN